MIGRKRINLVTMGSAFAIALFILGCGPLTTPSALPSSTGTTGTASPTATQTPVAAATQAPVAAATQAPAQVASVDIYVEDVNASPGGSIVVQIIVQQDITSVTPQGSGVGSADLKVVYDDTILTAVSSDTNLLGAFTNVGIPGEILVSSASIKGTDFLAGDPILEIVFDVAPGAPSGSTIVELEKASLTDTAAPPQTIQTATMDGTITIN